MNIFQIKSAADTIQKIQSVTITSKGPLDLADVTRLKYVTVAEMKLVAFEIKKFKKAEVYRLYRPTLCI